jgi:4-hydroxy-3-methylbut-2-enyl diphosphate reductase
MEKLAEAGADILGGCCGTDPDYIRAIAEIPRTEHRPAVKRGAVCTPSVCRDTGKILVIGDPAHPEVQGIVSFAQDENGVRVIASPEEAQELDLPPGEAVTVVAQTTFRVNKFQEIVAIIKTKEYDVNIAATICSATDERQKEAAELAARVDAMLVIGAPNSSNSVRLVEVAEREGVRAMLIQRADVLDWGFLDGVATLGITAGASAPELLVRELVTRLSERFAVTEREIETTRETITFKLPRGLDAAA